MMKKKLITLLLATSMIACLASCGNTKKETKGSESVIVESTSDAETKESSTDTSAVTDTTAETEATETIETGEVSTTPTIVSSDDPTIFDGEETVMTLREYLDQNVVYYQTGNDIGAQNGDVFKERGYDESYNIIYQLCMNYSASIDVVFFDAHRNPILIDFIKDGYGISIDRIQLHMNDDTIDYITYDGSSSFYTFSYDEDGNLIQYSNRTYTWYSEDNPDGFTVVYAYPVEATPDDFVAYWFFTKQGDLMLLDSIIYETHYKFENEIGDNGFHYVKSVEIDKYGSDPVEIIEY